MEKFKRYILPAMIVVISFILAIVVFPKLPVQVPAHWNYRGEVDGYMGRFWGAFMLPVVTLAMYLLFLIIPGIDPKKRNIAKFRGYFDNFIILIMLFMMTMFVYTLLWTFGHQISITYFMTVAFAILFYYVGVLIGNAQQNWFIGIRTPWTLDNVEVWDKTHQLGGKLYQWVAGLSLLGLFFADQAIIITLVLISGVSVFLVVYSYVLHRQLVK